MSFKLLTRLTVVLTATMLVAGATAVSAATPTESSPNRSAEAVDQLLQKANEQARVPVIVTLNATPSRGVHATDKKDRDRVAKSRDALLSEIGPADALKTSDEMPVVAFHATADQLKKLRRSANVVDVVEDREVEVPNDVMGTSNNGAANGQQITGRWDDTRVRADVARANGWNGTGQVVAVIDSGVDRTNPYLVGDVVAEACYSTNAIGYTAGGCPNGRNVQTGTGAAAPCVYTGCAHGTHVAHTAAGAYGVAPGAKVIAVQIFHWNGAKITYWESDILYAMSYVYSLRSTYRIAAVNMSIGGYSAFGYCDNVGEDGTANPTYLTGWFSALRSAGIVPVVASGNNDWIDAVSYPACISHALSVGNTTLDAAGNDAVFGNTQGGSNSNNTLDLLAPGTDICSAVPMFLDGDGSVDGWQCGWIGTSMAAPHVAGAIAMLRQYRPAAAVTSIEAALVQSGQPVYDSRNGVTRNRLDVWGALNRLYQLVG